MATSKAWGMPVPEPTERQAQAIEGNFCCRLPPVGELPPPQEQAGAGQVQGEREQGEQKAIGQGDQQEHFVHGLPVVQTKGVEEEFGFLKTEMLLDLEAPDVGKDDLPGLLSRL